MPQIGIKYISIKLCYVMLDFFISYVFSSDRKESLFQDEDSILSS